MSDRIDERIDDPFTVDDDVDLDDRPPAEFEPVAAPPDDGARFDGDGEFDSDAAAPRDHEASLARRAGTRLVRRPVEWWNRPWDTKRTVTTTATALTLTIVTLVMMKAVSFWPFQPSENLVFKNTTPNGGDMGAHVWGPAYLRDVLLPSGRLNGWTMDWYAGMPAYRFYMIPPALVIVALNVVFPYGIAFKIVAVTGLVLFPVSCWAFGRLARFRYPMPELFAFAALCFALDESFSIYGGNLKSTMAGEFSFSIAITAMMFGLGLLARGLETGKYRAWAALLLAFAAVSHGIVLIYVAVAASVFAFVWLVITYQWADDQGKRRHGTALMLAGTGVLLILAALRAAGVDALAEVGPLPLDVLLGVIALGAIVAGAVMGAVADTGRRIWYIVTVGVTALLLLLWWAGPFLSGHDFMTDMKYEARPSGAEDSFWDMFFPHTTVLDVLITGLALIGLVAAVARRHITGVALGVVAFIAVAGVYFARDGLPFIGLLWNPRVLPLLYLMRYLLMAIGVAEIGAQVFNMIKNRGSHSPIRWKAGTVTLASGGLAVLLVFGFMFEVLPGGSTVTKGGEAVYAWGPIAKNGPGYQALGDSWAKYNFRGYEEKDDYPEYRNVVTTMGDLGETRGCGRAYWEHHEDNGKYGTPMALMLLPFWTDGCIASMEGLFFEASGTTPYHFLATAAMSEGASNPVRKLRYSGLDASVAVPEMQSLGIRYVMLRTRAAKEEAATNDQLVRVARSGPWAIYELANSAVVEPLGVQPVVVNTREGDQRERNLELGTSWFQNRQDWRAMPADGGPDSWQRINVRVDERRRDDNNADGEWDQVDVVEPANRIRQETLDPVQVSEVEMGDQSLSFRVDRPGVPVLVKVSYFPNWSVEGGDGPWRIGPNMMVVVPTDEVVTMRYEQSKRDYVFYFLTIVGLGLCVLWRVRGSVGLRAPDMAGGLWTSPDPAGAPPPPPMAYVPPAPPSRDAPDAAIDGGWVRPDEHGSDDDVTPLEDPGELGGPGRAPG